MKQLVDIEKVDNDYAECIYLPFSACFQVMYTSIQRKPLFRILIVNLS